MHSVVGRIHVSVMKYLYQIEGTTYTIEPHLDELGCVAAANGREFLAEAFENRGGRFARMTARALGFGSMVG